MLALKKGKKVSAVLAAEEKSQKRRKTQKIFSRNNFFQGKKVVSNRVETMLMTIQTMTRWILLKSWMYSRKSMERRRKRKVISIF